ncbi:hypothetical protein [Actinophytocola gossypii]|uniref:Uncharacterized protein n=1 Tax=Actinophytocola gossypii TaxID=2812003 RepID=A0ABT2JEN5_9PSEU|nr:hypothetical protein [Actinophytocola gossypii]MCT2585895.1 hypothetical protein [Actinophytocola gossypii]
MSGMLYMQTGEMAGYQAGGGVTPPQLSALQSQMAEGQYFSQKDHIASQSLGQYVPECNTGLQAYTNTAHHATNLYVSADQSMAGEINYLTDAEYDVRAFDVANASPGERPVGVPDEMSIDAEAFEQE